MKKQSKAKKAAKVNAANIAVGSTTAKYKAVKFDAARVIALFKEATATVGWLQSRMPGKSRMAICERLCWPTIQSAGTSL